MSVAIAVTAFLLIFPVELPDKTFVATLVLATRYKPLPVWLGVSSAFAVQTVVAVTLGGLIGRLPRQPVERFASLMILTGGRSVSSGERKSETEDTQNDTEFGGKNAAGAGGAKTVGGAR